MSYVREVDPDEPCDRCGHASKWHAAPPDSHCRIVGGPAIPGAKAHRCPCDGFFPKPRAA